MGHRTFKGNKLWFLLTGGLSVVVVGFAYNIINTPLPPQKESARGGGGGGGLYRGRGG